MWFKTVCEGEQYGAVVLCLQNEKKVRGRAKMRQSIEEWRWLLDSTRRVYA